VLGAVRFEGLHMSHILWKGSKTSDSVSSPGVFCLVLFVVMTQEKAAVGIKLCLKLNFEAPMSTVCVGIPMDYILSDGNL
jgi:hypothetical protein